MPSLTLQKGSCEQYSKSFYYMVNLLIKLHQVVIVSFSLQITNNWLQTVIVIYCAFSFLWSVIHSNCVRLSPIAVQIFCCLASWLKLLKAFRLLGFKPRLLRSCICLCIQFLLHRLQAFWELHWEIFVQTIRRISCHSQWHILRSLYSKTSKHSHSKLPPPPTHTHIVISSKTHFLMCSFNTFSFQYWTKKKKYKSNSRRS